MRDIVLLIAVVFACSCHCITPYAETIAPKSYAPLKIAVARTSSAPEIDGRLDDICWVGAALAGGKDSVLVTHDGKSLAEEQAVFYLSFDNQALYVAIANFTDSLEKLKATALGHDDVSFAGAAADGAYLHFDNDGDKIFINTDPFQTEEYFVFEFTCTGVRAEAAVEHGTMKVAWDADWQVKTGKDSISWTAEAAIPFAALGVTVPGPGDVWGFNLARAHTALRQWSVWSCTHGALHKPDSFGHLVFSMDSRTERGN